jgi:hypothetical protein
MANEKKIAKTIVEYILLVIGFTMIIYYGFFIIIESMYWVLLVVPLIIGVILFVIGLVLRIRSGKKLRLKQVKPITE